MWWDTPIRMEKRLIAGISELIMTDPNSWTHSRSFRDKDFDHEFYSDKHKLKILIGTTSRITIIDISDDTQLCLTDYPSVEELTNKWRLCITKDSKINSLRYFINLIGKRGQ